MRSPRCALVPHSNRRGRALVRADPFPGSPVQKAVDILQPDVSHAGGLAETKRIAHLAHLHLIPVAPHNPVGPVMNAMTLHTAVAIPNFSVFETVSVDVPWRKELVNETLVFEDGHLLAPTAPGLGVELQRGGMLPIPLCAP